MKRLLIAALLTGTPGAFGGCAGSSPDDRSDEVLERAAFLFGHHAEAQKKQDTRMLGVVRSDLRRLSLDALEVLIRCLSSKDLESQGYAAFALGFSGSRAAIAPLTVAAGHADETVRSLAIVALGQLGFADAPLEPFRALLKDPSPGVRQAVLFGLTFMVGPQSDVAVLDLVHPCFTDEDPRVRCEALILVRKMKRKESVAPILADPLKDPEPEVRAAAAHALAAIGREAKDATPFLVELLKDEQHRVVEGAWAALNKIHDKDLDRSYSTWRDWYEDEQRVHYTCLDHKEVSELSPGICPKCRNKLERISRDVVRKVEPPVTSPSGLFVCPDHPEVLTTTASKCGKPGCGKDLVARKADPVIYMCPDHPEIVTTSPSKCGKPGCGKDLLPRK
jgi:HEAT repeat protein